MVTAITFMMGQHVAGNCHQFDQCGFLILFLFQGIGNDGRIWHAGFLHKLMKDKWYHAMWKSVLTLAVIFLVMRSVLMGTQEILACMYDN